MDGITRTGAPKPQFGLEPVRVRVFENEDGYVLADYLCDRKMVTLHLSVNCTVKRRKWLNIFDILLAEFREKGYMYVYATPYESDVKAQRLIAMFGFCRVDTRRGFVIMRRKV